MSYILDALTKAAQQRDRQVPAVQRLLTRAPLATSVWSRVPGWLLVALTVNAGLLALVLVWWSWPSDVATPPPASVPVAASTPVEVERPVRLAPPKAVVVPDSPVPAKRPPATLTPPGAAPTTRPPDAVEPRPGPSASLPTPRPATPPAAPARVVPPPVAPQPPAARGGLKLEALIYSDVPAQRMVFVNGRRYVEGDIIDGRLRIEEIQEDGVQLSDQGRRFTLRVER